MDVNRYTATLSAIISMCKQHVKILEGIEAGKMDFPNNLLKEQIAQIVVDNLVLRLHCLVERSGGVVSFEKLAKDLRGKIPDKAMREYEEEYADIKSRYANLLRRVENNRNIGIAHLQKTEQLGWDNETASKLEAIWGTENVARAVSDEHVFITPSNLSMEEVHHLLIELEALVVHYVWFPGTHGSGA